MASEKQSRIFLGVLYPDSEDYDCSKVLLRLEDTFTDLAYITHDMDADESGTIKKAHIHWCGKRETPAPITTISNALGVKANSIEFCGNWKSSLRYLTHADSPDKFQYPLENVTANFDYKTAIEGNKEAVKARKIYNHINDCPSTTMNALAEWCFANDLWSEFRRSYAIWNSLLREIQYDKMVKKEK